MLKIARRLVPGVLPLLLFAGCGDSDAADDRRSSAAPPSATANEPHKASESRTDTRGDTSPAELDLVRVSVRRDGDEHVVRWTLAATPSGTLVAVQADTAAVAAVKVYDDETTPPDAYVVTAEGQNKPLDSYTVDGDTITLRVPDADLGSPSTLTTSTERVGEGPADSGPTLDVG